MKGTPEEIKDALFDFQNSPKWDSLLNSVKILERIDEQTLVCVLLLFVKYSANFGNNCLFSTEPPPFPQITHSKYVAAYCVLKEARDFVLLWHWFRRPEDESLCIITTSVKHPDAPPIPEEGKNIIIILIIVSDVLNSN